MLSWELPPSLDSDSDIQCMLLNKTMICVVLLIVTFALFQIFLALINQLIFHMGEAAVVSVLMTFILYGA